MSQTVLPCGAPDQPEAGVDDGKAMSLGWTCLRLVAEADGQKGEESVPRQRTANAKVGMNLAW